MTCSNCGTEAMSAPAQQMPGQSLYCPNCGALLRLAPPHDSKHSISSPGSAQSQLISPSGTPHSPGPLLTGRVAVDTLLGFLEEMVGVALIVYALVVLGTRSGSDSLVRAGIISLGSVLAASFLFWHATTMRKRYPSYARGSEKGRVLLIQGKEHLLTLVFGIAMLVVLFPLGGLLLCLGGMFPGGWIFALLVAYCMGLIARRMSVGTRQYD